MMHKRAKIVIKDFDPEAMYCPSCLTKLEPDGDFVYVDVCNNECSSVKYVCPSTGFLNKRTGKFEQCLCHEYDTFWDDNGDFYGGNEYKESKRTGKRIQFIHGDHCYGAFNSFAKQSEVSIYRHNLKQQIYLHPGFCLWFMKPYIDFRYTGDRMGNVLKRTWKLEFLKKDKGFGNQYCIHWVSGYRMVKHSLRRFKKERQFYRKNPNSNFAINNLYKEFEPIPDWDKRWWRSLVHWYISTFYYKTKQVVTYKKFKK